MFRVPAAAWMRATIAMLFLASACAAPSGGGAAPSESPAIKGGTVTVRLTGDWTDFDAHNALGVPVGTIFPALFDRLIVVGPDNKPAPYLAKSWKQTPTEITFTLRDDASCSDGTKITPSVVSNSFAHMVKGSRAPQILGPGPYALSADDAAGTFTMKLGTPNSDALWAFAHNGSSIICPAGIASGDKILTVPVGSGPFTLVSAVHGDNVTLKVRPDWKWGPYGTTAQASGFPETLIFKVIANDTTAANLLLTGGVDVSNISGFDIQRLVDTKTFVHETAGSIFGDMLLFNGTAGRPTAERAVREALATSVDRNAWNQAANQGRGTVSPSIVSKQAECFDPSVASLMPAPSVDKARAVLQAAGYTAGANGKFSKGGKPLAVKLNGPNTMGGGPEYLADQFDKAGFAVERAFVDFNTYVARNRSGDYDVSAFVLGGDGAAMGPSIGIITGPTPVDRGANLSRLVDPAVDKEIAAAFASVNPEKCRHWSNVQSLMLKNFDMYPLAIPETHFFGKDVRFRLGVGGIEAFALKRLK